jgi:polysaccharide export outer membrane protein
VLKPGQYVMPEEKETIMDAIAMAGDLTIFGKRENVLLIRQNVDGTRTAYRVNLKKSDALNSPVYFLRQNDFIYVEPRKAKSDANDAAQVRYYGIAAAVASILIIIATRAK